MTLSSEDLDVSQHLAKPDRLSVLEKEQVLQAVLARTAAPSARRRWVFMSLPVAAVAAASLLVMLRPDSESAGTFTARGAAVPHFELRCSPGPACARGATLVFRVREVSAGTYFAAFARRADGTLIWYDTSPAALLEGDTILDQGIVLGDGHTPGSYELTGVFSPRPLDRESLRQISQGTMLPGVHVQRSSFVVE